MLLCMCLPSYSSRIAASLYRGRRATEGSASQSLRIHGRIEAKNKHGAVIQRVAQMAMIKVPSSMTSVDISDSRGQ